MKKLLSRTLIIASFMAPTWAISAAANSISIKNISVSKDYSLGNKLDLEDLFFWFNEPSLHSCKKTKKIPRIITPDNIEFIYGINDDVIVYLN